MSTLNALDKIENLKKAIVIVTVALSITTGFWTGFGIGQAEADEPEETDSLIAVREAYSAADRVAGASRHSYGEKGTEVYTIEIWADGSVKVTTMQGYINQLSKDTLLITGESFDTVQKRIDEMMDME